MKYSSGCLIEGLTIIRQTWFVEEKEKACCFCHSTFYPPNVKQRTTSRQLAEKVKYFKS